MFGKKVRFRSPNNFVSEMEAVVSDYGINHFQFIDDTLTLNHDLVYKMCDEIKSRGLDITWEGWTRATTINERILTKMKKAGLVRLSFGIESGNPEILKTIKKGVTLDELKKGYRIAKKVGLETRGSVMLGHPCETKDTLADTLDFIQKLNDCDQMYINITTPYPGTELYDIAKKGECGMRLLTTDFSSYKRYGNAVVEVNDLSRQDLIRHQRLGFLKFYLTPKRILYNLRRAGIRAGLKNAVAFLRSVF